jgi:hypothetical protein
MNQSLNPLERLAAAFLTLVLILWAASISHADEGHAAGGRSLSTALNSVDYLLRLIDNPGEPLDPAAVSALIAFVRDNPALPAGSADDAAKELDGRNRSTGIYYRYEIDAPLEKVVTYLYHPEIPCSMIMPSSIRLRSKAASTTLLRSWAEVDGRKQQTATLRGEEYEENTPDLTTGGYYRYDNKRLLVVLAHEGAKYLLSVTRQKGPSTIGRKGVVIGKDQDWNYFYSPEQGLTLSGLGWVDSSIYDSASVSVLHQVEHSGRTRTRQDMFLWKRAGWSGLNMVKAHHLESGCRRYADGVKSVLESPMLPPAEELASMARRVGSLSDKELRRNLLPYTKRLQSISANDPVLSRREFQSQIQGGEFLNSMDKAEMTALLLKEQLKARLGRSSLLADGDGQMMAKGISAPARTRTP